MPSISNNLSIANLTKNNYNSIELALWDIATVPGAILTGLNVEQTGTSITVRWGDRTQNNTTVKNFTVNHTY